MQQEKRLLLSVAGDPENIIFKSPPREKLLEARPEWF
jgi:hypothetical protein